MLMTMSDAMARPLWSSLSGAEPGYTLAGSPIFIASQMPDVLPVPRRSPSAIGNKPT
jgi:predicted phage gp36 major capsid-like protein